MTYSSSAPGNLWYIWRPRPMMSIQGTMYIKADASRTRMLGGPRFPSSSESVTASGSRMRASTPPWDKIQNEYFFPFAQSCQVIARAALATRLKHSRVRSPFQDKRLHTTVKFCVYAHLLPKTACHLLTNSKRLSTRAHALTYDNIQLTHLLA